MSSRSELGLSDGVVVEKDIVDALLSESSSVRQDGHGQDDREAMHLKREKDWHDIGPVKNLHHVLSRRSTRASRKIPGPPPDGGTKAWLQGIQRHSPNILLL
jgi:hypothetical protein